jgi:type II secretory pathway pseudopilin PulG
LLIVITLLAIVGGLALPMIGNTKSLKVQEAAKMLAADIELAQNESIAHADDLRLIKFDTTNNKYWVAAASTPNTPITDIVRNDTFLVQFGTGRASGIDGVTIQSISLGGDSELHFDAYGGPDQTSNATIILANGSATMTVQVAAGSGEVTIY